MVVGVGASAPTKKNWEIRALAPEELVSPSQHHL